MIICGFPGIGKTFCADNIPRVIDLEEYYPGDFALKDTLRVFDSLKYDVMLDIRLTKKMKNIGMPFIVVIPSIRLKEEYIQRYRDMKKSKDFISDMQDNWEERINKYLMDFDIQLDTLTEGQYLSNRFLGWSSSFKEQFGISLVNRVELKDKLRQVDSVEWEYNNPHDKVMSIIDSLHEYRISRKESVRV